MSVNNSMNCVLSRNASEPFGRPSCYFFFFFNDPATPEISPLSLPAPLPISAILEPVMAIKYGRPIEARLAPVEAKVPPKYAGRLDLASRPRRNRKPEWTRRMVRENVLTAEIGRAHV